MIRKLVIHVTTYTKDNSYWLALIGGICSIQRSVVVNTSPTPDKSDQLVTVVVYSKVV